MKLVTTGPDELGGALYVEKKYDGSRFDLKFAGSLSSIASQLKVGDIVERMMENGDLCAVNRQPSLHKYSIMAMRVKVLMAGSVFKINLSVTSPFNADFVSAVTRDRKCAYSRSNPPACFFRRMEMK